MAEITTASVIAGLMPVPKIASDLGKAERTVRRYIKLGMPVTMIGGTPYVDPQKARTWFEAGMPGPQPAPRGRR
jgi:hypothetical protein